MGRQFTRAQRTALIARDRTCIRPSCNAKRGLEFEHRDSYANTLATSVDSGARVCRRDHTSRPTAGIGTPGVPDFGSGICLTAPSSTSDRNWTGRAHSQRPGNRSRAVPGSRCAHTAFRRAGRVTGVAFDRRVAGLVWRSLPWLLRTRLTRAFLALAVALGAGYHYDVGPSRSVVARGTRTVVSAGTDQVQRASARSADMLERVLLDVLDQAVPTPTP